MKLIPPSISFLLDQTFVLSRSTKTSTNNLRTRTGLKAGDIYMQHPPRGSNN